MSDVVVGARLQLDANDGIKSMKELKGAIRDAQLDLINMQNKFGETSAEAINAAKRVNDLKDKIKDAKEVTDLFDPGKKFQVVSNAVQAMTGGFTALTGAMGLLGVESAEVQKQLLKVQSALALSQGLSAVADSAKEFRRLGNVLVQTLGKNGLIGIAIAGVAALGLAIAGVFTRRQRADAEAYKDTLVDYQRATAQATEQVIKIRVAFDQARTGVISKKDALKQYNDTLGDSLGKTDNLATAEKNLADKADSYIKITALKAQANALFAKAAEASANAMIAQDQLIRSGILDKNVISEFQRRLDKAKSDAKEIENLGANLLRQAGVEADKSGIAIGGGGGSGARTPAGKQAEAEARDVAAIDEYRLARTQTVNEKLALFKENLNNRLKKSDKSLLDDYIANQAIQREQARLTREYEEYEANLRITTAQSIGMALGALSNLVGKQTAVGKAFAIAEATINTYLAATAVLKNAGKGPQGGIPGFAIAQMIATIVAGLATVRNIIKTNVPGHGAGSGSVPSISSQAPLQPQFATATTTRLDTNQLNQLGNATFRAFVVESDVTNNQERIRRLNRQARI